MTNLSLVCPTARSKEVCVNMLSSLKTNINLEVIFVGPVDVFQGMPLPVQYRFITSRVKPVQCWQIGMNASSAETVGLIADDEWFIEYSWDEAYETYKSRSTDKSIVSLNWWEPDRGGHAPGSITWGCQERMINSRPYLNYKNLLYQFGAQLPTGCCVMSREFFNSLGGYDRRFVKRQADWDVFLRAITHGAVVEYVREGGVFEDSWPSLLPGTPTNEEESDRNHDFGVYYYKWGEGTTTLSQKNTDELFECNETICTITQGFNNGKYP